MDANNQNINDSLTEPVDVRNRRKSAPAAPPRSERRGIGLGCFIGTIVLVLLLGMVVGVIGSVLYADSMVAKTPITTSKSDPNQALVVQLSNDLLTQVATKQLKSASTPGTITNLKVSTPQDGQLVMTGDDQLSLLGIPITRSFRVTMQPYIDACKAKVRVLSVDSGGIPVTGLVDSLEETVNSQLNVDLSSLLNGFSYCATGVSTNSKGMVVSYSVTPK